MSRPVEQPANPPARWRREVRTFVELFALSGLAIAQPVLDVFGRAPDQFIFRGAERGDIVTFALLVVFAVPIALWLIEVLVGLVSERARDLLHTVLLTALAAVLLTLLLDQFLPRVVANLLAVALAAGFAVLFRRTRGVRIWLAFLSPAPVVFLAVFLLASQTAPLLEGPAGALGTPVRNRNPTIVILFDEFPLVTLLDEDGDIDRDLFPNFARLADTSHWFRQTTTVASVTAKAAPAILTGIVPDDASTPDSTVHPNNLFTLVGGAMPVTSSEAVTRLCPASVCERIDADTGGLAALLTDARDVLFQRLSPSDPESNPITGLVEDDLDEPAAAEGEGEGKFGSAPGDGGVARFRRLLDSIDGDDAGLHYLHLLLPHSPYRFLPDGDRYPIPRPDIGLNWNRWADSEPLNRLTRQRFLLQVQWVDQMVGELIDDLEEKDLFDRSNIVIVSDHGFGFEPGGPMRAMTDEDSAFDLPMAEILWVPLIVKASGQTEGVVSDDPVRNIDLVPTLADLLDVEIPWEMEGRSAFDGGSGDPDRVGMHLLADGGGHPSTGIPVSFDRDELHDLLMTRTSGAFAPAEDGATGSDRIYRLGPRPDLFGEPLPDGLTEIDVEVHEDAETDAVDPASGTIPALYRAAVDSDLVGRDVAIAVDGTVWATTTVHDFGGAGVAAMLPPRVLRPGSNTVTVHLLD